MKHWPSVRCATKPSGNGAPSAALVLRHDPQVQAGQHRLDSRNVDPKTRKRRKLGTSKTRAAAEKHERAVQFFKRRG